jgi:hypothetical protein
VLPLEAHLPVLPLEVMVKVEVMSTLSIRE